MLFLFGISNVYGKFGNIETALKRLEQSQNKHEVKWQEIKQLQMISSYYNNSIFILYYVMVVEISQKF